jgi:hypothetical protein
MRRRVESVIVVILALAAAPVFAENLIEDPSFELTKPADRFGLVWEKWGGWNYEGDCEFRVGEVAHGGEKSALLYGVSRPKIRVAAPERELAPGRYRVTAWLRGLDVGPGLWNRTTEFMFDGKYIDLKKGGTFGWSRLTYVADVTGRRKVTGPSFGLFGTGFFWIDDVSLEKVGNDVATTDAPIIEGETAPVAPPSSLDGADAQCGACGYKNHSSWGRCYACGAKLAVKKAASAAGPAEKVIASFETNRNGFDAGEIVAEHATLGEKALRLDGPYTSTVEKMDWTGYDYLMADLYTDAPEKLDLYVEIRDDKTTGYWTRVNYNTVVPPGKSTLILPTNQYVGEKSRPGRPLDRANVRRLVFGIGEHPSAPLFIDNIRLVRDDSAEKARFEGLWAFDFGTATSPVMDGFTQVTPASIYSGGRGYGLMKPEVWRAYDALQPEPLYEDAVILRSGGMAIDVPNGKYHVFVNIDSPSGFWGEYQVYRERSILAEGERIVHDTMDFASFNAKYYRFWDSEDLPGENTFDKYQETCFDEKEFDVEVRDGQLNIDFNGSGWAVYLSAMVVYPAEKSAEGEHFLEFARERRRFHFDNYFKRILHKGTREPSAGPAAPDGRIVFARDYMDDVYYNDMPRMDELATSLSASAFAGEYEPMTFSIFPLKDFGEVTVSVSDLSSGAARIAADCIDVGYVSYRLSRVTMEGSVYTIAPRLIMPSATVDMPKDVTRRFWLTVKVPSDAVPGVYTGEVKVTAKGGGLAALPLTVTVLPGTLDKTDVPVGPWGHKINTARYGNDPASAGHNEAMARKSLAKLAEHGFTSFSGLPVVTYRGFKDGKPVLDFAVGDAQMKRAREAGFAMPVANYCPFVGLNLYYKDIAAMQAAGFSDYSAFVKAIFSAVEAHAEEADWLEVYWNLGDEPIGENLTRSIENAREYKKAFPEGPPYFTAATSFTGDDAEDPHFKLASSLHVANVNNHDEPAVDSLHGVGVDWAFYNSGSRWTYGDYLYKAVRRFGAKFRLSWHWNVVAGDPYYALDCREDDYAWCNSSPDGTLIPSVTFERLREGLDDYRRLITLERLAKEKAGSPEAAEAEEIISRRMAAFRLGERNRGAVRGIGSWDEARGEVSRAISALRKTR